MDELGIDTFDIGENNYTRNDRTYSVKDLIEVAKKYEPFDLLIKSIDIGSNPWGELSIKSYAYHIKRMNEANMDYPIILDDTGYICDGWHRLLKAIVNGQNTIKAVRLTIMPDPQ